MEKILFITPKFPPDLGGASYVFGMLSKNISERGHSVIIVTSSHKGFLKREQQGNVKIYRLFPYYEKIYQKILMLPLSFMIIFAFFMMNFRKFNVVESHTVGELCIIGQLNSKLFRKSLIKHVIDMQTPKKLLRFPMPEYFVCCGDCIKKKIVSAGLPNEFVHVINLPLAAKKTNAYKNSGKFRFIFIGEISEKKGVHDILSVLEKIKGDFEFIFVGNGPLLNKIKAAAEKDERIIVKGFLKNNEILNLLKKTDVLVHPSYADVMPISILEAMSSGNAIIASDIGEIKKNVSDAGLFIKPGDTNTLEKHMQKALKNMNILKKNAIRNFNAYTKNDVYEQNLNVIKLASRSH